MNKKVKQFFGSVKNQAAAAGVGALVLASSARADIDTSGVTSALTEAGTAAGLVGAAVLIVLVGIKAFKYIRSAM